MAVSQPVGEKPQSGMTAGRIVLIILGSLALIFGLGLAAGGGVILFAQSAFRDAQGFFVSGTHPFSSTGYAVTSTHLDLGTDPERGSFHFGNIFTLRLRVSSPTGKQLFVGIASTPSIDLYLAHSEHDNVTDVSLDPFEATYDHVPGDSSPPGPPTEQHFWVEASTGPGGNTLTWQPRAGHWTVVIMNADGSTGVDARLQVGVKVRYIGAIAAGLLIAAVVFWIGGAFLLYFGLRRPRAPAAAPA